MPQSDKLQAQSKGRSSAIKGAFMGFKLIVAVSVIAAIPVFVQAQAPSTPKPTRPTKAAPAAPATAADAAQRVVKIVSGDKVKTSSLLRYRQA